MDVSIPDAEHAITGSFEEFRTGGIIVLSVLLVVRVPFQLSDQAFGGEIEPSAPD